MTFPQQQINIFKKGRTPKLPDDLSTAPVSECYLKECIYCITNWLVVTVVTVWPKQFDWFSQCRHEIKIFCNLQIPKYQTMFPQYTLLRSLQPTSADQGLRFIQANHSFVIKRNQ